MNLCILLFACTHYFKNCTSFIHKNTDHAGLYYEASAPSQYYDLQSRAIDSLGKGNILRAVDSLGQGNILRSLSGLNAGEWGNSKANSWRFGSHHQPSYRFSIKRVSGLDSLGGGNILRNTNDAEEAEAAAAALNYLHEFANNTPKEGKRAIDSLGKGNILKREAAE